VTETEKAALRRDFERDGYVLIRRFFDRDETAKLVAEVTSAKTRLDSTLDAKGLHFREFMYHFSPYLQSIIASPKVVEVMTQIIGPDLWVRRDTAIIKTPGGQEFPWHQDNGYNKLLDPYVQFWVALTPMSDANGGVWLIPGSHKRGLLPHTMKKTHFIWDGTPEGHIPIEAEAGDVLLFSSYILHRTGPNCTQNDRIAYLVEFMDRRYFDPYTKPPFFMVSEKGVPKPHFTRFYEGNSSLYNYIRYIGPRTHRRIQILRGQIKRAVLAAAGRHGAE
jgi:ectoine hydroxylase-related dioxygenase (phytanoyl-CoA dioxygenase family)